jgi:hypothetical protein
LLSMVRPQPPSQLSLSLYLCHFFPYSAYCSTLKMKYLRTKCLCTCTWLHGVTFQKTAIFIFSATDTSDEIQIYSIRWTLNWDYIPTYTPIARQRLGKHFSAEATERNNTSVARQRISTHS